MQHSIPKNCWHKFVFSHLIVTWSSNHKSTNYKLSSHMYIIECECSMEKHALQFQSILLLFSILGLFIEDKLHRPFTVNKPTTLVDFKAAFKPPTGATWVVFLPRSSLTRCSSQRLWFIYDAHASCGGGRRCTQPPVRRLSATSESGSIKISQTFPNDVTQCYLLAVVICQTALRQVGFKKIRPWSNAWTDTARRLCTWNRDHS